MLVCTSCHKSLLLVQSPQNLPGSAAISTNLSIINLPQLVQALPQEEQQLFHRIFRLTITTGHIRPPASMLPWIERQFGSLERVSAQRIVKLTNLVTLEGTLYNEVRASRPQKVRDPAAVQHMLEDSLKADIFNDVQANTPEDTFGRVRGQHSVTAANVAKYDGLHSLVIFNEPHPLRFTRAQFDDYLDTALSWAQEARKADPEARYFLLIWNCLWRAGASQGHGHFQMALSKDMHYARIEHLRRSAVAYRSRYGSSYFDDLYRVHLSLGCAMEVRGTRVLAHLTPLKEKEMIVLGQTLDDSFKGCLYRVVEAYVHQMGVSTLNMALTMPPFGPVAEDWQDFPVLVRLVDRGDPANTISDIGAMELYAQSVVSSDPLEIARSLRTSLRQ